MAISPLVIGARSSASATTTGGEASPTPAVIAPAATMPFFKNDRRLLRPLNTVPSLFISLSFPKLEYSTKVPAHPHPGPKAQFRWDQELRLGLDRWSEHSPVTFTRRATIPYVISPSPACNVGFGRIAGVTGKSR